jgi:hypothetical protein
VTAHTAATIASHAINQAVLIAPPPPLSPPPELVVAGALGAVTFKVVDDVAEFPALSVMVRLTTTVPAADGSKVTVAAFVALVKAARSPPVVIVQA